MSPDRPWYVVSIEDAGIWLPLASSDDLENDIKVWHKHIVRVLPGRTIRVECFDLSAELALSVTEVQL